MVITMPPKYLEWSRNLANYGHHLKFYRAVRHDILEFSARVLAPHRPQRTQFHPID